MPRVVIIHPKMGIYLGSIMGLGFWSKLDPVGQDAAVTFPDADTAERSMQAWDGGRPDGATTREVFADHPTVHGDSPTFASIAACVAVGLEAWDPES